ncbi:RNA-binding protein [Priestia koreensis]|uniref:RNA-binding protein n=1 Tax=Priestia koreensis TaxID=284581 RepID=A0A0M0KQ27_9BACI|nr:RNA-binding protein [Priestia koreensis]KOO40722.1 RNA-binding protein [Priestia koreensis]
MSIYQHFRKEEHEFIDHVLEWKEEVQNQYSPKLTDFLDPREQEMVSAIIGKGNDVLVSFFGGVDWTERKRALLYPDYYTPTEEDYGVACYEIEYPQKFVTIEHPQILGSLMSLGLRRSKFGDITVGENVQLVVAKEIASYIEMNLESIGRAKVSLRPITAADLIHVEEAYIERSATVSSLRIDVVLAAIHNLSRQKVQPFISSGHVKVNWKVIEQPSFECQEGDVLSLRGHGRSKILTIDGKTKKDKWRISVGKQK